MRAEALCSIEHFVRNAGGIRPSGERESEREGSHGAADQGGETTMPAAGECLEIVVELVFRSTPSALACALIEGVDARKDLTIERSIQAHQDRARRDRVHRA